MFRSRTLSPQKKQLVLILVGILGLAICGTVFFTLGKMERPDANSSQVAAKATPAAEPIVAVAADKKVAITNVTVEPANAQPSEVVPTLATNDGAESKVETVKKNRHSRLRSAHNQIASRLPAPVISEGHPDWHAPHAEVEMWSGTRKSVVVVPQGAKFED